jgi:hypothetical protein
MGIRTVALVALALAVFVAAPAYAETWVLWYRSEQFKDDPRHKKLPKIHTETKVKMVELYPSQDACTAELHERAQIKPSKYSTHGWVKEGVIAYMKLDFDSLVVVTHYRCLPTGIDPYLAF